MNEINLWGWEKKSRTMLRFIKQGDVFSFHIKDNLYGFGCILAKVSIGHVAELFELFLPQPILTENELHSKKVSQYVILDSYSLFDRKLSGEWRIIGNQKINLPIELDSLYFYYGADGDKKRTDIYGNIVYVTDEEAKKYLPYSPKNDFHIKRLLNLS